MTMQLAPVPCNVPITARVTVNRATHHVRTAFFRHSVERCELRMQSFLPGQKKVKTQTAGNNMINRDCHDPMRNLLNVAL